MKHARQTATLEWNRCLFFGTVCDAAGGVVAMVALRVVQVGPTARLLAAETTDLPATRSISSSLPCNTLICWIRPSQAWD